MFDLDEKMAPMERDPVNKVEMSTPAAKSCLLLLPEMELNARDTMFRLKFGSTSLMVRLIDSKLCVASFFNPSKKCFWSELTMDFVWSMS